MRKLPAIAILLVSPLFSDDRSKETLSATHTDRFNLHEAGAIRLENSYGEVDIDGWDRPEVEVSVVRSSEHLYGPNRRSEAQRRLDSILVESRQSGNDVVISTKYPARNSFLHPLSRRSDIGISYRIQAPRASKLTIEHNSGGVNVSNISGDIHARVGNGQITLTLPPGGPYGIDAQCAIGDVYSDFEGRDRRRGVLGEEFTRPGRAPAASLFLRVRVGDIVIMKLQGPPAD